jgi:putative tryptophan/tyrosine transport system substrate-binding protein
MKRGMIFLGYVCILIFGLCMPGFTEEKTYKIEVLQVTGIDPYQKSYMAFVKELENNGIVQGKNLVINRKIIAFDVEKGGLWKKLGVLMDIKSEASRIVSAKPDLVLTIGTPATRYAKDKIVSAGIPLVFTAVAIPTAAGCKSMTEAGVGFTGSTLYMNMNDGFKIVKLAFPKIKTVGMIHSDDENGIAHVEEAKKAAPSVGMNIISMEVSKNDKLTPTLEVLQKQGAEAFAVPLDTYYGIRNYEACRELEAFSTRTQIPVFSFALMKVPGAILYVGSDFGIIGQLSGQQAVKIIRNGVRPDTLPILKQEELKILVDTKQLKALNYQLPMEILMLAKDVE